MLTLATTGEQLQEPFCIFGKVMVSRTTPRTLTTVL